ncbi:MAG: sigma-54 interaction domain-containing protein [Acidobacteriota bacterium]
MASLVPDPTSRRILDAMSDGVIVTNAERKIVFINETARVLLGYGEGEALDQRCRHVTQSSECDYSCPMTRAIQQDRDLEGISMFYRTRSGQLLQCRTRVLLLRDGEGKVVGGVEIFTDTTQVSRLQEMAEERYSFASIIGKNAAMQEVFDLIRMVAETDSTVLVTGESGTGKELVASAIHFNSLRKNRAFVKVNCAALNEGVLESELFGHVRGAFTGAVADKMGRFEMAHGGTLFLDEIGEIPPSTQVKLLRVLQEGEMERVGSSRTLKVDVRVIAATNRDLEAALKADQFRQDLYYRLNVFRIRLPALRERREDIPLLVDHFLRKIAAKMPQKRLETIEEEALLRLMEYDYPGNVRELANLLEHAAIRCRDGVLRARDLPLPERAPFPEAEAPLYQIRSPLETVERDLILKMLEANGWKISRTAERLGISRVTLWRKMREYGISKPAEK